MTDPIIATYPFPRTRWQAGGLHLGVSILVGLILFALIRFAWYPDILFDIAGGSELAMLIIACDIVIGPLLTTVVFKRGKKTLRFDLAVILLLQLAAFGYGSWIMFSSRPAILVAAGDRVYAVGYNQIDPADWAEAPSSVQLSWWRPVRYAVANPDDPILRNQLIDEMFSSGKDLQTIPRLYRPFQEGQAALLSNARKDEQGRLYVPLVARKGDGLAILDASGDLKQMQEGDPWKPRGETP